MNRKISKIFALAIALVLVCSFVACGTNASSSTTGTGSSGAANSGAFPPPVELRIATFRVGTHNAAAAEARYIKEFEEKYNGVDNQKITIKLEEMPSDEEYYNQMKIRAASNTLPDIFEGNGGTLELAVQNGIAVDMAQLVDADPEYKAALGKAYDFGKEWPDGGLYNISYGLQAIGYFYNKSMYEEAGIKVPTTWEEWMENLEKLKKSGVCDAPLSMMTGENSWTTNLLLASMIGTSGEAGNAFMNKKYVQSYKTPEFIDAMEKIQIMLQKYALADAVGSDYATAANHFLNEDTAIIANGPWMTPDFSNPDKAGEGFAEKVGVALYPNNGSVSQFERGYSIAKSTPEKEAAAFAFIKFKTDYYGQSIHLEEAGVLPLTSDVPMSEEFKQKSPLVVEFVGLLSNIEYKYMTIDTVSYKTATDAFSTLYPLLADGSITAEQMAEKLDEAAKKDAMYGKDA